MSSGEPPQIPSSAHVPLLPQSHAEASPSQHFSPSTNFIHWRDNPQNVGTSELREGLAECLAFSKC